MALQRSHDVSSHMGGQLFSLTLGNEVVKMVDKLGANFATP